MFAGYTHTHTHCAKVLCWLFFFFKPEKKLNNVQITFMKKCTIYSKCMKLFFPTQPLSKRVASFPVTLLRILYLYSFHFYGGFIYLFLF